MKPAIAVSRRLAGALALATAALAGCRIDEHKGANGRNDVNVGTPFGSVHVKTDKDAGNVATGLTPYPGAKVIEKNGKEDGGAADIGLNFGDFHLGVHAVELQTPDPADKVLAFYRRDLARFGDIIECRDNQPVGQPAHTSSGLGCNDKDKNDKDRHGMHLHVHDQDSHTDLELRAGSPEHQHIVGVETKDGATRIGLVALDLPHGGKHAEEE